MSSNSTQILFYGLSGDPVHQVHIDLVSNVITALSKRGINILKVIIVPVFQRNDPPDAVRKKVDLPNTYEDRVEMCKLAADEINRNLSQHDCQIEVSRIAKELAKSTGGPNYDVETLLLLKKREMPEAVFYYIISSDLLSGENPEFGKWHRPDLLVQLTTIVVCPRIGYQRNETFLKAFEEKGSHFIYLDELVLKDTAASRIKVRIQSGEDPLKLSEEGLLPPKIATYIKKHNLYRKK